MAVKKEQLEVDSAEARVRPIEYLTENGFSIERADENHAPRPAPKRGYVFIVRNPKGTAREIRVRIHLDAVNEITLRGSGRIANDSSYWICCAERHLADYLWEHDDYPPTGNLTVELLTIEDLNLAIRWGRTQGSDTDFSL
jgi:hypothetical protein